MNRQNVLNIMFDAPTNSHLPTLYGSRSSFVRQQAGHASNTAFELASTLYAALPSHSQPVRPPSRLPPPGFLPDNKPSPPFFKPIEWHRSDCNTSLVSPIGPDPPSALHQTNRQDMDWESNNKLSPSYSLVYSPSSSKTSLVTNQAPLHPETPIPQPTAVLTFFENHLPPSPSICSHQRHHQIYTTCLAATKRYILAHRANYLARAAGPGPSRTHHQNPRSHPYTRRHQSRNNTSNPLSALIRHFYSPGTPIPSLAPYPFSEATDSLLQNVTTICDILWHRAQQIRLDELGVERRTVAEMGNLLTWAETIEFAGRGELGKVCCGERRVEEVGTEEVVRCGRMLCGALEEELGFAE